MSRFLTATAILALSAGIASAEVTLSGDARMGIIGGDGVDTAFTSRARVKFTLSGETDGGLAFGASFRANDAAGAASGTAGSVFISGAFGKLSMGDVDGAANAAVGNLDGVGLTGLGDLNENIFVANGGLTGYIAVNYNGSPNLVLTGDPSALYEYSAGNLALYASLTNPSYVFTDGGGTVSGKAYSVGAAYSFGSYKVSAAYEYASQEPITSFNSDGFYDHIIVGADGTFGAVTVKARYGRANSDFTDGTSFSDLEQWGLSATYTTGALALTAFASNKSDVRASNDESLFKREAYGLGASYDLGGGAKVVGGYSHLTDSGLNSTPGSNSAYDLGLSFDF
jgi:outer membrane protein OmpU